MSVTAMSAVWRSSAATKGALLVMLALADWADDAGFVVYRNRAERRLAAIAEKTRVSRRQIIEIIDELEAMGELEVTRGGKGQGDVHEYRILLPGLDAPQGLARPAAGASPKGAKTAPLTETPSGTPVNDAVSAPLPADKGAETAPKDGEGKGAVFAIKGAVFAVKGAVSAPHIDITTNQLTSPLAPLGEAANAAGRPAETAPGGAAAKPEDSGAAAKPEDSGAAPAAPPETGPASWPAGLAAAIEAKIGAKALAAWFSRARVEIVPAPGAAETGEGGIRLIVFSPTRFAAEIAGQRYRRAFQEAALATFGAPVNLDFAVDAALLGPTPDPDADDRAPPPKARGTGRRDGGRPRAGRADGPSQGQWLYALAVSWAVFGRWDARRFGASPEDSAFAPPADAVLRAVKTLDAARGAAPAEAFLEGPALSRAGAEWRARDAANRLPILRRRNDLAARAGLPAAGAEAERNAA